MKCILYCIYYDTSVEKASITERTRYNGGIVNFLENKNENYPRRLRFLRENLKENSMRTFWTVCFYHPVGGDFAVCLYLVSIWSELNEAKIGVNLYYCYWNGEKTEWKKLSSLIINAVSNIIIRVIWIFVNFLVPLKYCNLAKLSIFLTQTSLFGSVVNPAVSLI